MIDQDLKFEGDETVLLHLSDPSETAALGLSLATLTIEDDDPFIPLKAMYCTLVKTPVFDNAFTGVLSLKADGFGNVTGSLTLGGHKLPIMVAFDGRGKASHTWQRTGLPSLTLTLAYADEGDTIRATITDGTKTVTAAAGRIVFGPQVPIVAGGASFTVQLAGDRTAAATLPLGDGFLSVSYDKFGSVKLSAAWRMEPGSPPGDRSCSTTTSRSTSRCTKRSWAA